MDLGTLSPDLLYCIVFGPGFGESIVLRPPSGEWIVVDGSLAAGEPQAAALLEAHSASWSCVILTHPHKDHALGLDSVLARPGSGLVGTATLYKPPRDSERSVDPDEKLRAGTLEHVLATIKTYWRKNSSSKWEMRRGDVRQIGDLHLTVLHPDEDTVDKHESGHGDPNRVASPLLVEWKKTRLVLGSDLLTIDWGAVSQVWADLGDHGLLKVPHHGSIGAQHDTLCPGTLPGTSPWIVTPYNIGQKLPRFEKAHGIEWLLRRVPEVHLTALPVKYSLQGHVPYRTTRQDVLAGRRPRQIRTPLPAGLAMVQANKPDDALTCFVAVGLNDQGAVRDLRHGPGSLRITEAPARIKRPSRKPSKKPGRSSSTSKKKRRGR